MKVLGLIIVAMCFSLTGYAASIDAPGQVFYKMPNGEIVKRAATLQVPSRGQGQVVLKGAQSNLVAERFFSKKKNGRTIFYVVFDKFPGKKADQRAVYRGTYARGSNMALYYGDVFIVDENDASGDDLHYLLSEIEEQSRDATYVAGFYFKSEITD